MSDKLIINFSSRHTQLLLNNHFFKAIELCCKYADKDTLKSLRQCSKKLNEIVNPIFFSTTILNLDSINIIEFYQILEKYKPYVKVMNVRNLDHLYGTFYPHLQCIKAITFNRTFNSYLDGTHSIDFPMLVPSLEYLEFKYMGYSISNIFRFKVRWPPLKALLLGGLFNQPIKQNELPLTLEVLKFGDCFNKLLTKDVLPSNLLYLEFGNNFNQPIEDVLPSSLLYLEFGNDFNQPIENILPLNLLHLKLGDHFNRALTIQVLPPKLKYLEAISHIGNMLEKESIYNKSVGKSNNSFIFRYYGSEKRVLIYF